jgi:hypothetical protein
MALDDSLRDASRGACLCETCFDAMTDLVLPGDWTATGLEEACCAGCWPLHLVPIRDPRLYGRLQPGPQPLETHDDRIDSLLYAIAGETANIIIHNGAGHSMVMQWNALAPRPPDTNRGRLGDLIS